MFVVVVILALVLIHCNILCGAPKSLPNEAMTALARWHRMKEEEAKGPTLRRFIIIFDGILI